MRVNMKSQNQNVNIEMLTLSQNYSTHSIYKDN